LAATPLAGGAAIGEFDRATASHSSAEAGIVLDEIARMPLQERGRISILPRAVVTRCVRRGNFGRETATPQMPDC
jgi:hypothetical protein